MRAVVVGPLLDLGPVDVVSGNFHAHAAALGAVLARLTEVSKTGVPIPELMPKKHFVYVLTIS
mgnify:CR=1 FL=1